MKRLMPIVFLILMSTAAFASYTCLDSNTSYFNTTIAVSSSSIPISYNETCNFGCKNETGECNPSPYDVGFGDVGILIAIPLIAIVFFYLSGISNFSFSVHDFEFDPFELIFIFTGIILLITEAGLLMDMADNMNKSATSGILSGSYMAIMYGSYLVVFLLLIYFLISFMKNLINIYRSRKR